MSNALIPYKKKKDSNNSGSVIPYNNSGSIVTWNPSSNTSIIDLGITGAKKLKEWLDKKNKASQQSSGLSTYSQPFGSFSNPQPSELITYPQPITYPTVTFSKGQLSRQILRWSKPAGSARSWGPGLYDNFVGGGFVDPFLL